MNVKVYTLTLQSCKSAENTELSILGVFTTKTKAKEVFAAKKKEILDRYENEEYNVSDDMPTLFSISEVYDDVWDELLITENILDKEEEN